VSDRVCALVNEVHCVDDAQNQRFPREKRQNFDRLRPNRRPQRTLQQKQRLQTLRNVQNQRLLSRLHKHLQRRGPRRRPVLKRERRDSRFDLKCKTVLRKRCSEPTIDFYVFIEGKCEEIEEEICRKVPSKQNVNKIVDQNY